MNYLAHGFRYVGDPWLLAGTALPDWLRVLGHRLRLPPEAAAAPYGAEAAALARGVLRHQEDDRRFHGSRAFDETRREVTALLREALDAESGHRPSFIAHVLVEMELDASISDENPMLLDAYYAALAGLDPARVESAARELAGSTPDGLAALVRRFVGERFLGDYRVPSRLCSRLNLVLRRAGQPILPEGVIRVFPDARRLVEARRGELLAVSG